MDTKEFQDEWHYVLIETTSDYDAPGYALTGGYSLCASLEEAKKKVEQDLQVVWSDGFENNPDHEWTLVAYEVFKPTELVIKSQRKPGMKTRCHEIIFCYYRPVNPSLINAMITANHEAETKAYYALR